jgi:hypothetical protein
MGVRFAVAAAAALLALAAGCGGHSAKTRLTIQQGQTAYDLRCDPPAGTVADAAAVCRALAREPELLVDGPGIEHSCPEQPVQPKIVGVRGQYRGYNVRAVFADTTCGWVPGQGGALAEWTFLLHGSGPGRRVTTMPSPSPVHVDAEKVRSLRRTLRQLVERRKARGDTRLDDLTLTIIRTQDQFAMAYGTSPLVAREDVFRAPRRKFAPLLGSSADLDRPAFLVVTHYAYRDYAGRKHVATDGLSWAILSARTMEVTDWGLGGLPSLRSLGPLVTLDF